MSFGLFFVNAPSLRKTLSSPTGGSYNSVSFAWTMGEMKTLQLISNFLQVQDELLVIFLKFLVVLSRMFRARGFFLLRHIFGPFFGHELGLLKPSPPECSCYLQNVNEPDACVLADWSDRCKLWAPSDVLVNCCGPVAQRLEQGTHNPLVPGSNPGGPNFQKSEIRCQKFRLVVQSLSCGNTRFIPESVMC